MLAACVVTTLLEHPASPVHHVLPHPTLRRVLTGLAMGLTGIGIVYSPFGKQSGAHFNPSVTLTFFRLGKVAPWDAFFYVTAQFAGGTAGVLLAAALLGGRVMHPSVQYAVTVPGEGGPAVAFLAEAVISFLMMTVVLTVSNTGRLAPFTGLFAGALVATYISLEAPLSGMSMNPARTFASAVPAQIFTALWVYFTAPLLGMLLAAEVYLRRKGPRKLSCAKLHHQNDKRCIFCGTPGMSRPRPGESRAYRDDREEASCDTTRSLSAPAREETLSPRG
jgi:aquaporin Z